MFIAYRQSPLDYSVIKCIFEHIQYPYYSFLRFLLLKIVFNNLKPKLINTKLIYTYISNNSKFILFLKNTLN